MLIKFTDKPVEREAMLFYIYNSTDIDQAINYIVSWINNPFSVYRNKNALYLRRKNQTSKVALGNVIVKENPFSAVDFNDFMKDYGIIKPHEVIYAERYLEHCYRDTELQNSEVFKERKAIVDTFYQNIDFSVIDLDERIEYERLKLKYG